MIIGAVWISALLLAAGLLPVPELVVPPHAARSRPARPAVSPRESRIDLINALLKKGFQI
jgi:hypothetical protein